MISQQINQISNSLFLLEKQNPKKAAIVYMLTAQILYSIMYLIIGFLRSEYLTLQILYVRMFYGLIFNTSFCYAKKLDVYVEKDSALKLLIWRGIFGALGMILMFASINFMNLSDCVVINNLSPIWTNIMAIFFLGEKFSKKALICFFLGFSGIVLMSRPSYIFSIQNNQQNKIQDYNQFVGTFLGLLGSISVASITITLKMLTSIHKCHNIVQQQYSYIVTIFSTAVLLFVFNQAYYDILNFRFIVSCFFLSLIGWIGQLLFSRSYGLEKTSLIAPITYINSFISFLADLFIFNSEIQLSSIIGSILIISGSLGVIF
ncbi:hypothetical protein ABPG74_013809 [Tetrahymena malaccensis]